MIVRFFSETQGMPQINRNATGPGGQRHLLRNRVYCDVRGRIVSGDLSPGDQISIEGVATGYGVSRTPVREALLQLAEEELVVIVPQVGASVSLVDLRKVYEAQFVREVLERACLAAGAKVPNPDIVVSLSKALRAQRAAIRERESAEFYRCDEVFHNLLCSMSGHSGISKITNSARAHLDRLRQLSLRNNFGLMEALYGEHRILVEALGRGDFAKADQTLRDHLRRIFRYTDELRQRHPEFFVEQAPELPALGDAVTELSRSYSSPETMSCPTRAAGN